MIRYALSAAVLSSIGAPALAQESTNTQDTPIIDRSIDSETSAEPPVEETTIRNIPNCTDHNKSESEAGTCITSLALILAAASGQIEINTIRQKPRRAASATPFTPTVQ